MDNITLPHHKTIVRDLKESIKHGIQLIKSGHFLVFFHELRKRIYSKSISVGLRRLMEIDFQKPDARIDILVRPLEEGDFDFLTESGELERVSPREVELHRAMIDSGIPQCYVAVNRNDEPCYMQWLISSESNDLIEELFGNSFPQLKEDEGLLEGAYMHRAFRGLHIMPAAMSRITEKALEKNIRAVMTFVDIENIPSLKGCKRSGFSPYLVKKDRWFLFHRSITFQPLTEKVIEKYNENTA